MTNLFFQNSIFHLCFLCFQSIKEESNQRAKRGIKRAQLSWTEAEIHSRRMGVEAGAPFVSLLSFPTRPLRQFPCNIIRSGGGELSVRIFRKIDQGPRRRSHVSPSRENASTLLGMTACANESLYQTMFSSLGL